MKEYTDAELVLKAKKEQDSEAFNELIERHSGIFVETVSKYCPVNRRENWLQELLEEKHIVFWSAVESFQEEKSKFHTWLANLTRYRCQKERMNQEKQADKELFCDLPEGHENFYSDPYDYTKELEKTELISIINEVFPKKFSDRDCQIFNERFFDGKKLNEIADKFGIKHQRVFQIQKKMVEELKKKI